MKETIFYKQRALYNFPVTVSDTKPNNGIFNVIIEVEDLPNEDPVWVTPFASAQFPEKEAQTFSVFAIDGDTGINTAICYRVEFEADKDCKIVNLFLILSKRV